MITTPAFPSNLASLRDEIIRESVQHLEASYSPQELDNLLCPELDPGLLSLRDGAGVPPWEAFAPILIGLQELVTPGVYSVLPKQSRAPSPPAIVIETVIDALFVLLAGDYAVEMSAEEASEKAAGTSLFLISKLPSFRERAGWNQFASLKDPAVWTEFALFGQEKREELGKLDLIPEIDEAIRARNKDRYLQFLREHGSDYAFDYQIRLVQRAYPGWRALLLHDITNALALGGRAAEDRVKATPVPFLPRIISEHLGSLYQTDLHPETQIGDANFIEHPHRGITTGQTGKIGIGCVIYPCTLGGVTDKVKQRHPILGDFVLIGTDVGIYGPVQVGEGSVVGPNTEINGLVTLGKGVKIRAAVVARTLISESGRPGRLIFADGAVVGEEALIINDQPTDLLVPAGFHIPPNSHVINDGTGKPKIL